MTSEIRDNFYAQAWSKTRLKKSMALILRCLNILTFKGGKQNEELGSDR